MLGKNDGQTTNIDFTFANHLISNWSHAVLGKIKFTTQQIDSTITLHAITVFNNVKNKRERKVEKKLNIFSKILKQDFYIHNFSFLPNKYQLNVTQVLF